MSRSIWPRFAALLGLLALAAALSPSVACGPRDGDGAEAAHAPHALADQEGAVCGMLVRDQSAPRAQVVHRDGERAFLCSLGDLLVHLGAPSPHGSAHAVFVEVLEADADPLASHTGEHDWLPADEAVYVVGVERRGIMGEPVLAYASTEAARAVAARHAGAQVLDFDALAVWWSERHAGE